MNLDKAKAIINQAKIAEIYEGPIPDDEEKAISEAGKLVELAQDAWNQSVRGAEVESILRIANDEFGGVEESEPEAVDPEPEEVEEEELEELEEEGEVVEDGGSPMPWEGYNKELAVDIVKSLNSRSKDLSGDELRDFLQLVWKYESATDARQTVLNHLDKLAGKIESESTEEHAEDELEVPEVTEVVVDAEETVTRVEWQETPYRSIIDSIDSELASDRRHAPEPPSDEAPELPWDWTKLSDTQVQSLYSYYSVLAYHKNFLVTREDRIALECKRAADELANELISALDKYDEKGKEKKVTLIEAEVEADHNVSNWRRMQRKHEAYCAQARRERDSLYKIVEALSRFETMRQQEWQRSGQSSYK
jgi:hypothetical protein